MDLVKYFLLLLLVALGGCNDAGSVAGICSAQASENTRNDGQGIRNSWYQGVRYKTYGVHRDLPSINLQESNEKPQEWGSAYDSCECKRLFVSLRMGEARLDLGILDYADMFEASSRARFALLTELLECSNWLKKARDQVNTELFGAYKSLEALKYVRFFPDESTWEQLSAQRKSQLVDAERRRIALAKLSLLKGE